MTQRNQGNELFDSSPGNGGGWQFSLEAKPGKVEDTRNNIVAVLEKDEGLGGRIRYDTLSRSIVVTDVLPWDSRGTLTPREWSDFDDAGLRNYLEQWYGFDKKDKILDALLLTAHNHEYSPVCEFLESLEWDGKKRVSTLLHVFLGADTSELSSEVTKLMMRGAIARAVEPGIKFDFMPVLVGKQGCGKSTFVKRLGVRPQWVNENFATFKGKEAIDNLRGIWIAEVAELSALKRARDSETIKAFLSSAVDDYREPYARRTEKRPRANIFIGTTNNRTFLSDLTGNRRFLPIDVGLTEPEISIHSDEAQGYINQAWAEAMHYFIGGEKGLVLPPSLEEQQKANQERFEIDDGRVGIIQRYLDVSSEERVCIHEICERALGLCRDYYTGNRALSNEIAQIMDNKISGWVSNGKQRFAVYGTQKCWKRQLG